MRSTQAPFRSSTAMPRARSATSSSAASRRRPARRSGSSRASSPATARCATSCSTSRAAASSAMSTCWCRQRPRTPQMGFIIMEPEDTPPMSGSNCICVATVLLDTGIVPMTEPETRFVLEAPAGLVEIRAACRDGKAERITLTQCARLRRPARRAARSRWASARITVDIAFGGDSFVLADARIARFRHDAPTRRAISPWSAAASSAAANEQIGFSHPTLTGLESHFLLLHAPARSKRIEGTLSSRNACVINPGKIDRSPTGTGCSALMAVLHAKGQLKTGDHFIGRSIIELRFHRAHRRRDRARRQARRSSRRSPGAPGSPAPRR